MKICISKRVPDDARKYIPGRLHKMGNRWEICANSPRKCYANSDSYPIVVPREEYSPTIQKMFNGTQWMNSLCYVRLVSSLLCCGPRYAIELSTYHRFFYQLYTGINDKSGVKQSCIHSLIHCLLCTAQRPKLWSTRPQLLQIQRIGREGAVVHQHARSLRSTQTRSRCLLHRSIDIWTRRRRRFLDSPLHREARYCWVKIVHS